MKIRFDTSFARTDTERRAKLEAIKTPSKKLAEAMPGVAELAEYVDSRE